jgi:aminoethylphosphonate catabolism LysR family transcriptional regulator
MSATLTLLRAFHHVASAGGFTRGAIAARVSQPTLSAQVRSLETAWGVSLFDRRGRGVALTPLGRDLHLVTARLFAIEAEAIALLAGTRLLAHGELRVAADSPTHVMPILARLRRAASGLGISLRIDNSARVLDALLSHEADIGVCAKATSDPRLNSRMLRRDRLVLFAPRGHPLAKAARCRLSAVAGAHLVIRERGSVTREVFEAALASADIRPASLMEVETREAVNEAVRAGFGLGVVFRSEFNAGQGLAIIEIADADLTVAEYVVCLATRASLPMVQAFLKAAEGERENAR